MNNEDEDLLGECSAPGESLEVGPIQALQHDEDHNIYRIEVQDYRFVVLEHEDMLDWEHPCVGDYVMLLGASYPGIAIKRAHGWVVFDLDLNPVRIPNYETDAEAAKSVMRVYRRSLLGLNLVLVLFVVAMCVSGYGLVKGTASADEFLSLMAMALSTAAALIHAGLCMREAVKSNEPALVRKSPAPAAMPHPQQLELI